MDSNTGRKPRRASRKANRHTQLLKKPLMLNYSLRKLVRPSFLKSSDCCLNSKFEYRNPKQFQKQRKQNGKFQNGVQTDSFGIF
jgi:hypothetical protein